MDSLYINLQHIHLLLLIIVANGGPIIISKILGQHFNQPIDFKTNFLDGRPIFGTSKTWRGLLAALVFTSFFSYLLSYSAIVGAYIALAAMVGDLISSFIKRRLKKASSSQVLLLDQIPECVLPLILMRDTFLLQWPSFIAISILFIITELSLSKLLKNLYLR
jgi:CDP-2,3-bis-(O-geranylgeranyl)-sn-glycerol synthase